MDAVHLGLTLLCLPGKDLQHGKYDRQARA